MESFQPHLQISKSRVQQLLFDGLKKVSDRAFTAKHALHFTNDFVPFEICLEVPLAITDQSLQWYKAKDYNLSHINLILHFVLVIHSIKNVQSLSHIHIFKTGRTLQKLLIELLQIFFFPQMQITCAPPPPISFASNWSPQ